MARFNTLWQRLLSTIFKWKYLFNFFLSLRVPTGKKMYCDKVQYPPTTFIFIKVQHVSCQGSISSGNIYLLLFVSGNIHYYFFCTNGFLLVKTCIVTRFNIIRQHSFKKIQHVPWQGLITSGNIYFLLFNWKYALVFLLSLRLPTGKKMYCRKVQYPPAVFI